MTTLEFLSRLRSLGVRLWVEGDQLCYRAPEGALTPALRTELVERKAELLAILRRIKHTPSSKPSRISTVSRDGELPLSFAQERLWFLDQLEPSSPVYNISVAYRLRGALDVGALQQSLSAIVRRHEALRTTFADVDGRPVQVIAPPWDWALPIADLTALAADERDAEAQRWLVEEARQPFDLAQDPLLRTVLLRLGGQAHLLLLTAHHIVCDGWSMSVFSRELSAFYDAFSAGKPASLLEPPIQYVDFAVWQRERLQGQEREAQLTYWRRQLGGELPVLQLPTDFARPAVQNYRGAALSFDLPASLGQALQALSRRESCTLFMTLLAAFKTLLYRYTRQSDVLVGSPIAGRNRSEIDGLIGFFLNTLVLRTDLAGNPSFLELLGRVREVTLEAYAHQDVPFEMLLEELRPERDLSRTPLFQVFFNMLNLPDYTLKMSGVTAERVPPAEIWPRFDLTLYISEHSQGIQFNLVYNADLFARERMVEMLNQLQHLLGQIVANPEQRIERFTLISPFARPRLPDPTLALSSDWKGAIHEHFSQQARQAPEGLAVVDPHECWTYEGLDARSNQLANYLIDIGIQPQHVVAFYGHRSASLVWAVLGVLKAGAAFLILDPAYPALRLIEYLRIARPGAWLQVGAAGHLPDALEEFVVLSYRHRLELVRPAISMENDPLAGYSTDNPQVTVGPDDLAYVAFTSGSTGKPKGILGRHGPLSHFLPWQRETFGLCHSDRYSMLSGLSHDPLQRDIFTALALGATLCIPDSEQIGSPTSLAGWMREEQISITHLTPPMVRLLAQAALEGSELTIEIPSLRYAFTLGDVLTRQDVSRLRELAPKVQCVNFYGATETQRAVGYYIVPEVGDEVARESVPLGRGIPDVQLLVLNTSQELAGVGELGEIYLQSPHLAQGYLNDDKLSRERFIVNPFTNAPGDRLYKTGDWGRYLPDGNVAFQGRSDDQVKVRGFRVELGEIQAVLGGHPKLCEAVVLFREYEPDDAKASLRDKRLVAYVVAKDGQAPNAGELRRFMRRRLPEYMVPSAYVALQALPLTPNGKLDQGALPAPDCIRPEPEEGPWVPGNETEKTLAEIWAKTLNLEKVDGHQDFFELGGHSLLAAQLVARVRNTFQIDLPLRSFFEAPTIADLAKVIEGHIESGVHVQTQTIAPLARKAYRVQIPVEEKVV